MLYPALLSQFVDPAHGSVLTQSLALGFTQIAISVSVNALIALAAGSIALFLGTRPGWLLVQRWLMGTVLAGLAVKMALETKRREFTFLPLPPAGEVDALAERGGRGLSPLAELSLSTPHPALPASGRG